MFHPILQDPAYHLFADHRTLFGIPNFWNVVTNTAFLAAALLGWRANRLLAAATAAVGLGSAWYHLQPDDAHLFWDRLPMAIVFCAIVAELLGTRHKLPLVLTGAASVVYWRVTGDLRFYAVIQFGAMLLVLILLLRRAIPHPRAVAWMLALYTLAKLLELADHPIAQFIPTGGHPWKHLAAAVAIAIYLLSKKGRTRRPAHPLTPTATSPGR